MGAASDGRLPGGDRGGGGGGQPQPPQQLAAPARNAWSTPLAAAAASVTTSASAASEGASSSPSSALPLFDADALAQSIYHAREVDATTLEQIRTDGSGSAVRHYVVPASWMRRLLRCIRGGDGGGDNGGGGGGGGGGGSAITGPGKIRNSPLLDFAAGAAAGTYGPLLRSDVDHGVDYYLVGEHVWTILSTKFGVDTAVVGSLKATRGWGSHTLMVELKKAATAGGGIGGAVGGGVKTVSIEVPEGGKWPYSSTGGEEEDVEVASSYSSAATTAAAASAAPVGSYGSADDMEGVHSEGIEITENGVVVDDSQYPPLSSSPAVSMVPNPIEDDPAEIISNHAESMQLGDPAAAEERRSAVILLPAPESAPIRPMECDVVEDDRNDPALSSPSPPASAAAGAAHSSALSPGTASTGEERIRRRYCTGLGNLGNTCFMNSTLQCLAHTIPIRQYFVYSDYRSDLNRDNPLGTGGKLTVEFANLLKEMWDIGGGSGGGGGGGMYNGTYLSSSYSSVVYPRQFKNTLGEYASQFMGYDQHDSQELAAFLLDRLHEDTNRITKKPFVEKPEKEDGETDADAAKRAWDAHLLREDSRILETFVGQGKTHLECPNPRCDKTTTMYDPFLFLSVPIPGAQERTMTIIYVPADPTGRRVKLSVTLSKTATVAGLRAKVSEAVQNYKRGSGDGGDGTNNDIISEEDLCLADVFHNKIWSWHNTFDGGIDGIRETDETYAYEVLPLSTIRAAQNITSRDSPDASDDGEKKSTLLSLILDPDTIASYKEEQKWQDELQNFCKNPTGVLRMLNKASSPSERMDFSKKMETLIKKLTRCSDATPEGVSSTEDTAELSLEEAMATNSSFKGIRSAKDLAIFQLCAGKFRDYISNQEEKEANKDGVIIEILMIQQQASSASTSTYRSSYPSSASSDTAFTASLVLRCPPSLTVDGLRTAIAERLARAIKTEPTTSGASDASRKIAAIPTSPPTNENNDMIMASDEVDPALPCEENEKSSACTAEEEVSRWLAADRVVRQIPMTYARRGPSTMRPNASAYRTLGSLMKQEEGHVSMQANTFASPTDKGEDDIVGDLVGNHGVVQLHWPSGLSEEWLDTDEWERYDDVPMLTEDKSDGEENDVTNITDCISTYCEKEQLEETETWYCNRCKDHVRAWKEEQIYRAPPILIIQLKRFQFSPTTHRRNKIDTFIDFPLEGLDLKDFVVDWNEGEEPIYDLYAVSNHFGGLGGGHYTAFALSDDGEWCNFDDSRISTGMNKNNIVSSSAYCLFYRRRDVAKQVDVSTMPIVDCEGPISSEPENIETNKVLDDANAPNFENDSSLEACGGASESDETIASSVGDTDDPHDLFNDDFNSFDGNMEQSDNYDGLGGDVFALQ